MRFEKKYRIESEEVALVKQRLRLHPAGLRKIYPDRQVNNIYFDTPDLITYRQNVAGINQRKKFRLRWYGEELEQIQQSIFEIKIKDNELGRKESQYVGDVELTDIQCIIKKINALSSRVVSLRPVIFNQYQRSYYGTADAQFRITVDWNLRYAGLHSSGQLLRLMPPEQAVVVEVKYDEHLDNAAERIFKYLPYRQTKNSKYVTGVESVLQ